MPSESGGIYFLLFSDIQFVDYKLFQLLSLQNNYIFHSPVPKWLYYNLGI